jgi:hypothetical protein
LAFFTGGAGAFAGAQVVRDVVAGREAVLQSGKAPLTDPTMKDLQFGALKEAVDQARFAAHPFHRIA